MSDVEGLVRDAAGILLDFDGPVCKLFAGYPAAEIADQLRSSFDLMGSGLPAGPNPLKVLQWIAGNQPERLAGAEQLLTTAELAAADSAISTEHTDAMLAAAHSRGIPVAIASNNSAEAVSRYLSLHRLTPLVANVSGRAAGHPERMKPDPEPVFRAASALGLPASACLLVGDSPSDMEAARKSGARCIGYAKTQDRAPALSEAGADSIIYSMGTLVTALSQAGN